MKIGFLSDAHGNIEAFEIGLAVLRDAGAERINFLGDAVGYLPGSSVVERIVREDLPAIQGNHEAMMLDGGGPAEHEDLYRLNETWREMAPDLRSTISAWPRRRTIETQRGNLLLIHGSPSDETYGYVYPDTELASFDVPSGTAVFMGNTHRPFVRESRGVLFVNVGSCGLPRDIGKLGSACLYDAASGAAKIIRFDISDAVESALGRCGAIAQDVRDVFARSPSSYIGQLRDTT